MATNLVIVSDYNVCFSQYFKKPNGLPTFIGMFNFLDVTRERFVIPLVPGGMIAMGGCKVDPVYKETKFSEDGPLAVVLYDECASETSYNGKLNNTCIPIFNNSFYCRSNNYDAEAAATAGSFIHNDAEIVYKETFKAIGENCPIFLKGDIVKISEKLKTITAINKKIFELKDDTENPRYKETMELYNGISSNWINFFEMKKCI